jgi:hypothetical protein
MACLKIDHHAKQESQNLEMGISGGEYISGKDYFDLCTKEFKQEQREGRSLLSLCMERITASVYKLSFATKRLFQKLHKPLNQ